MSVKKKRSMPGVGRTDIFLFDPNELILVDDEAHPLYDPRVKLPVDDNLVKNIMVHGVIEPVVVRIGGDKPEVVDGRRRTMAARKANEILIKEGKEAIRVPAVRRRGEDGDLYGVLVSANGFRHEDSGLEKAKKATHMLDLGKTKEEVCVAFGWTMPHLKAHLSLLDLSAVAKKAVVAGKLSVTAASKLSSVPHEKQAAVIEELLIESEKAPSDKTGGKKKKKATVKTVSEATGKKKVRDSLGKKEVKALIAKLEETESNKPLRSKWFSWGLRVAIGTATLQEAVEAGLSLPAESDEE